MFISVLVTTKSSILTATAVPCQVPAWAVRGKSTVTLQVSWPPATPDKRDPYPIATAPDGVLKSTEVLRTPLVEETTSVKTAL